MYFIMVLFSLVFIFFVSLTKYQLIQKNLFSFRPYPSWKLNQYYRGRNKTRVESFTFFKRFPFGISECSAYDLCTIVRDKISHLGCHTCYENKHFKSI